MSDFEPMPAVGEDPQDLEAFKNANPDVVAANEALAARSRARRQARKGDA